MKKISILFFISLVALISCNEENDGANQFNGKPVQINTPILKSAFPGYSFCLSVPWLNQVPPGDINNTKNCGQTCAVMLSGYFNNTAVNSSQITAENTWLYNYTGNSAFNNPNGYVTNASQI